MLKNLELITFNYKLKFKINYVKNKNFNKMKLSPKFIILYDN